MVWKWHSIDTRLKSEWTNFWLHVTHTWIFLECAYFWLPMSPLNYDSPRFALNSSNHFLELSHNTKKQRKDILVLLKWPVVKRNLTMFSMHTCVLGADWACINKSKTCSPSFGVPFVNLFFFFYSFTTKKKFHFKSGSLRRRKESSNFHLWIPYSITGRMTLLVLTVKKYWSCLIQCGVWVLTSYR